VPAKSNGEEKRKAETENEQKDIQDRLAGIQELSTIDERIHSDHIGEYKSELVKILFDPQSLEIVLQGDAYGENREIKKVDLNQLGYNIHLLREGPNAEKIFYGCKLIDSKKVFTVRSQF